MRFEESSSDPVVDPAVLRSVIRIGRHVLGVTLGLLCGGVLFLATNWLVLKGGAQVGPHLELLGEYFYGYTVSFRGSFVGLGYGFLLGYLGGWFIAAVYNAIALRPGRNPESSASRDQ